jgi:chemotaxis protein MotB
MNSHVRTKIVRWGLLALVVSLWGLGGCTAKYEDLLRERDRELTALKDERARLEVEVRTLRASEESMKERLKVVATENARVKNELQRKSETRPAEAPSLSATDRELEKVARQNGLEVKQRAEGVAVVLPSSVTFGSGSAKLTRKGRQVLDTLARTIKKRFSARTLSIEGHTDSTPIRKCKFGTNWRLSAERAETVRQYLSRKGLGKKAKIRVVGYGPSDPIASNKREAGRRQNRRVELVILNT